MKKMLLLACMAFTLNLMAEIPSAQSRIEKLSDPSCSITDAYHHAQELAKIGPPTVVLPTEVLNRYLRTGDFTTRQMLVRPCSHAHFE